jgi:Kae1-associated kinase Bud32
MKEKILKKGAEAELIVSNYLGEKVLIKKRKPKTFRNKELDLELRKKRTKEEAFLMHKCKLLGIRTPIIYKIDLKKFEIVMEFVKGAPLKKVLNKKNLFLCEKIGEIIGKMHSNNLIHGDLTTSNILVNKKEIILLDFGLGYLSTQLEDKAVDLLNFKKTFNASHSSIPEGWRKILKGYAKENKEALKVFKRLKEVELRARYL